MRARPAARAKIFFCQAEDGIRDKLVTGVQTCALPICARLLRLGVLAAAADCGDRKPAETAEDENEQAERERAPAGSLTSVRSLLRPARPRGHYAWTPLAHA